MRATTSSADTAHGPSATRAPRAGALLRRISVRVARVAILGYLAWCATLWFAQDAMIFVPGHAGEGMREDEIAAEPRIERRWLAQDDGVETEAWLVRSADQTRPARGLVVFTHGNAELIDHALPEADAWTQRGFDVLLPEYRGYGRTPGTPGERRIVADVLAHLADEYARGGERPLLLHGRSLGTGVAAQVAAAMTGATGGRETPAFARNAPIRPTALLLESPFTSVAAFAAGFGAPPLLVAHPFRTDRVLQDLDAPVLILHARDDEVVPISHGRALARASPRATLVELEGSHNSGLAQTRAYWNAIDAFLAKAMPSASSAAE